MNKNILTEGLDWHDLEDQIVPIVSIDEYSAHMGKDSEIITMAFIIKSQNAGNDLVDWFERGYDWVLDAELSEGELSPGRFVVFVEMSRRSTGPARIIELLDDLTTLTNIPLLDWTIRVDEEDYSPELSELQAVITISPHAYRETEEEIDNKNDSALNEMRAVAGLANKKIYKTEDEAIRSFKALAGL